MTHGRSKIFPGLARDLVLRTDPVWDGILVIEQHRAPPEEVAECCLHTHVLTLRLSDACTAEWRLVGEALRRMTVPSNSLSLVTRGTRLGWRRSRESEELIASLDPAFVTTIAGHADHGTDVEFRNLAVFHDPVITHILLALQAELRQACPAGRLYGESLATALAVHLLKTYAVRRARMAVHKGGLPPARLRRVLDYIEANLNEDTSLRQLAELVMLSPYHFATLFKQTLGLPPHRYVQRRRAARAKEMLADGRWSLADIAYALGYSSQAHFTTMFRKLTGATPGAYRSLIGASAHGVTAGGLRQALDRVNRVGELP